MSDTKISEAAVEAAAMVVAGSRAEWFGYTPDVKDGLKEIQHSALEAALPHLHPQPAELSEQQGVDAHTLWAMAQLAPGEGIEDGVQRIEEALAATGNQQVGEVQGDVRAKFEAWAKSNNYSSLKWPDGAYAEEAMQFAWKAWQHLAARQPGAQEQVAVVGPDFTLLWAGSGPISPIVERHGLKRGSLLYAAPPAQGIDLGPVAAMLRQARLYLQDGLNSQCMNKLDDLQTLIDQRDAAPGAE